MPAGRVDKLLPDKFKRSKFVNLAMLSGKAVKPEPLKLREVTCVGFFKASERLVTSVAVAKK
jgi:hypothetical protein